MLSYQHSYHAGCLADVHKHALLSVLLENLTQKERPISYLETHAGRGLYDLESPESLKTGEALEGIIALQKQGLISDTHPYGKALAAIQKRYGPRIYPGSPAIAQALLRDQDALYLMELHPQEITHLQRNFRQRNTHVHFRDGYEGVLGISPPPARRGLVLIDPSYEVKTEYQTCVRFIEKLHHKWPQAVIALWYPMLSSGLYQEMSRDLDRLGLPAVDHRAFQYASPTGDVGMFGTGLYIINTPWGVDEPMTQTEALLKKFISTKTSRPIKSGR